MTHRQYIEQKLQEGQNFSNEVSGWFTVNRVKTDGAMAIFHNEKYKFYNNMKSFSTAVARLIKCG